MVAALYQLFAISKQQKESLNSLNEMKMLLKEQNKNNSFKTFLLTFC